MTTRPVESKREIPPVANAHIVVQHNGWSYVIGDPTPEHSGPWRYEWEAQDYADELNAA